MASTVLYLTQTTIDNDLLSKVIFYYHHSKKISFSSLPKVLETKLTSSQLDEVESYYQKSLPLGLVSIVKFNSKKDYKETLGQFYRQYNEPTLLFLGSLNDYSEKLQEGMLKLLEEPPSNLTIILFATALNELLPTIKSRSLILSLSEGAIFNFLEGELINKVKAKLPSPADYSKLLIQSKPDVSLDLSKVEREELDFWLWQVGVYITKFYLNQEQTLAFGCLERVFTARMLNRSNVQKKLALASLLD
jgi:DNA polymerase III, delta subunit